ncbi:MFS transporter [uncultured Alsobacter sp.]|uniref:MFS transporter n=1 Tax=uncultured Alsobacter sp. TaxID=1748258 RepID=UPI0025EBC7F1|nr:MFS transporter [uncultured Alsobacter sp.]
MSYRHLLRQHGGIVLLGYGLGFLSSVGQTFFISLSGPDLRATFGLSNGAFGSIYSLATLCSGLIMIWAGGVLDRVSTRAYAGVALAGLGFCALGLSLAPSVVVVGLCLFGLRFFGQGMIAHAAVTAAARLPQGIRGRAVSIVALGFSSGEFLLPGLVLLVIATWGWVFQWRIAALVLFSVLAVVLTTTVLADRRARRMAAAGAAPAPDAAPAPAVKLIGRRDVLKDWRFLVFIPSMIAPSAIVTGIFFHQRLLADIFGWSLEALAFGIPAYAGAAICTNMVIGWLVDRFRAVRVCRFHLVFLAIAALTMMSPDGPPHPIVFFALLGVSSAANGVVVPAVLAELYGTERLGTIRALAGAIGVVGSASTPGLFGFVLDAKVGLASLAIGCAIYLAVASALNWLIAAGPAKRS